MLFWKNWSSPFRQLIWGLVILAVGCIIWFAFHYLSGFESIIGWDILAKTQYVDVVIDTFQIGPFSLSTSAENPIFFQHFSGSMPAINVASYYLLLGVTVFCINILLAIVTALPRFWYFIGIAIFALILALFKFELLLLFGSEQKWGLIIALILFLPTSYYFNIKPGITFLTRLLTFLFITAFLAGFFAAFSQVDTPFFYMAAYGMINPLLISLIFIIMIAHEIIASFIYLLTSSGNTSGRNTIFHFYVITAIYLINLVLAYLHETRVISWDIIYINLFLLLFISAILGFWGFARREEQYKHLFNFYPLGALAYLAMAICCFMTIGHFTATFNDPAIEVFRDFIIYAHLGFGLIFVVYITSNFLDPLRRNLQVHKILYKPTSMPYLTFRLAGLIAFIAFITKSNWEVPVNQSTSAYFNSIADLHYHNGETLLGETYYREGAVFGYNNHKSNYMLGKLAKAQNDNAKAAVYYKTATKKNPTAQSFVNLSNIYFEQSRFFDALFTLNKGLEKTESAEILNNIGVAYAKTNILDSAAYYLTSARQRKDVKSTAASNTIALLAKHNVSLHPDSILQSFSVKDDMIFLNNSFVLKNLAQELLNENFAPKDSSLSFLEASLVYNKAFNQLFSVDSLPDAQKLLTYAGQSTNTAVQEKIELAAYMNQYKNNHVNQAFRKLNWLANASISNSGALFNIVGLWAMEQRAPGIGVDYFTWAAEKNWTEAKLNLAIALTENLNVTEAVKQWNELMKTGGAEVKDMAKNLLHILTVPAKDFSTLSDQQKYLYTRYRITWQDTTKFDVLFGHIEDNNYRASALLNMSEKLWQQDRTTAAINYYGRLSGLRITDQKLFNRIKWYELSILAAQRNIRGLSTKINQGVDFDAKHLLEKNYFTALISEASGDTTKARRHYEFIAYKNPFLEEATIAAARFLENDDKFEAYNILLSAIEINPHSIKLLKAYILQAARLQLDTYAAYGLKDLKEMISADAFERFLKAYHQAAGSKDS